MFKVSTKLLMGVLALALLAGIGFAIWSGSLPAPRWERANPN